MLTAISAVALGPGCVPTMRVEVPATPAVDVELSRVAVQAEDRDCQRYADALVTVLRRELDVAVDPRASTRVIVHTCGRSLQRTVNIELTEDTDRRRLTVEGRGFAAATVTRHGQLQATLVGAGRELRLGAWGDVDVFDMSRAVDRSVSDVVAQDLAHQLSPVSRVAERRLYPSAAETSARGLTHRAVLAEADGDVLEAHRLASLAYEARPSSRAAAYLAELESRLRHQGQAPAR